MGLASPNPVVGCVIVRDGAVCGAGWHEYDKKDHAEVVALREAGERARGATAYVTLEPCSHHGRTGPCADALIAAGVARVVVATLDPNPLVSGSGIQKLREAGIEVVTGVLEEAARRLNHGFARYIRSTLPLVTLKAGLSLDGRIAPAPGQRVPSAPWWITSEESRLEVMRMRHGSDALITGINTVIDDDPLLTDRTGLPRRRPLLRVVLDSELRLPLDSKLVQSANDDVLVFCTTADAQRREELEARGVRVEQIDGETSTPGVGGARVSLRQAIAQLGELRNISVMIEAGSRVNAAALEAGIVDRVVLFYAPIFLGSAAVPLLDGGDHAKLAAGLSRIQAHRFGSDVAIEGSLRYPWDRSEEQQYEAKLARLRSAIDEGDASGIIRGDPFARVRKALKLPTKRTGP
ncbi:MAG: bifunctional diaminohydroxyphosphoribosylaminopyrimidine deaminase/5-amino-6-(5-phosphoribosylamino)uracil reductase RibD [Myxococcota bacterium]|nr:bifunctional diaminohydroxyphosphoribosylaminopyrimidine deaminase/5-amino-6-(5-phosphoribosylamino)uracil reductase RibD [Myxococcota bacterium]